MGVLLRLVWTLIHLFVTITGKDFNPVTLAGPDASQSIGVGAGLNWSFLLGVAQSLLTGGGPIMSGLWSTGGRIKGWGMDIASPCWGPGDSDVWSAGVGRIGERLSTDTNPNWGPGDSVQDSLGTVPF